MKKCSLYYINYLKYNTNKINLILPQITDNMYLKIETTLETNSDNKGTTEIYYKDKVDYERVSTAQGVTQEYFF